MAKSTPMRSAMAMIELIFAIVIVGFSLMGAPTLVALATSSATVAYQQESITIAAAHTSNTLTYAWDEHNTDMLWRDVLVVTSGDGDLDDINNSGFRGNSPLLVNGRIRKFNESNVTEANISASVSLGIDANETVANNIVDDVDDWDNTTLTLSGVTASQNTSNGEFIDQSVSLATTIQYADDTADYLSNTIGLVTTPPIEQTPSGGGTSNIKYITVILTSGNTDIELKKNIVMHAFMCNIGALTLARQGGF